MTARLPSIRGRLSRAMLAWALVWGIGIVAAVGLAVREEVDELLDDTLEASAQLLAGLPVGDAPPSMPAGGALPRVDGDHRFAWQVVGPQGALLQHSAHAPASPFQATPSPGFSQTPQWRVYGMALGTGGRMLYVAQTREERLEAQVEVALSTALAAGAIGLLSHLWLRRRARHELAPLERLSRRLAEHEPLDGASLGPAEREELAPVHAAIDALGARLAHRIAHERAFTAHAAHSLRTPLAGIDAQLAVALRESPPGLAPRLLRVREAAARLQRVVTALLALFRSGTTPHRQAVDVPALLARLPVEGLAIEAHGASPVQADPDLLAAALLNLLDNASRCGARRVVVTVPRSDTLRLHDDGPGADDARRQELQDAIDRQAYEGRTGLGLMLADLVARSHGGALRLPAVPSGFAVELQLAPGA